MSLELNVTALARQALDDAANDKEAAISNLSNVMSNNPHLRQSIINNAASAAIETAISLKRKHIIEVSDSLPPASIEPASTYVLDPEIIARNKRRMQTLSTVTTTMWLEFPLSDGTALKNATRSEILRNAESMIMRGKTSLHRGTFLKVVGEKVPEGKLAGDVLTEQMLKEDYEAAEKKVYEQDN